MRLPVAGPLASKHAIETTALAAADLGYRAVWVHDFIVWTRELDRKHISCGSLEAVESSDPPPIFHESLTNLAFLAGVTSGRDIRLGVAVLCLPYRNPIIAARQIANIDVLSDGRLILGVGVGAPQDTGNRDFEVLSTPRAGRYERTEEYVRTMTTIWTDDVSTFSGEYVMLPPTEFFPKPIQKPKPPIWIGGSGPKARRMVATFGDGWLPGLTMRPPDFPEKIDEIRGIAQEIGRADFDLEVGIEITGASIATSSSEARRSANRTLESVVRGYGGGSHGSVTIDGLLEFTLIGSPDEINQKVDAYVANGVDHFELKFVYHSLAHLLEQMELFSEQVMPHWSQAAAGH